MMTLKTKMQNKVAVTVLSDEAHTAESELTSAVSTPNDLNRLFDVEINGTADT